MIRADFQWVNFDTQFDDTETVEHRTFFVEGNPIGTGYLLIQARDVDINPNHREFKLMRWIFLLLTFPLKKAINVGLPGWIVFRMATYIPVSTGSLFVALGGADDFFVANVAVHWREVV